MTMVGYNLDAWLMLFKGEPVSSPGKM